MERAASHPPDRLAHWLGLVITGLRAAVAGQGPKAPRSVPLIVLAHKWLGRVVARFEHARAWLGDGGAVPAARAEGSTAPRGPRAPAGSLADAGSEAKSAPSARASLRLPRGRGWLILLAPETAKLAGQLQAWLADPEVVALLRESEPARRIVRPLCKMLALRPGPELALVWRRRRRRDAGDAASATDTAGDAAAMPDRRAGLRPRIRRARGFVARKPIWPRRWRAFLASRPEFADGFT